MSYLQSAIYSFRLGFKAICGRLPRSVAFAVAGLLFVCTAVALQVGARRVRSSRPESAPAIANAADRARPFLRMQDGRQLSVTFRGANAASQALQSGQAAPTALVSADLDGNGTPDVVAGYGWNGTGIITIQRGNPDAFAPKDESVYARIQGGYNPDPLLPEIDTYQVPAAADFVGLADADQDGLTDIVFASRGGGLYFLKRGQGLEFGEARQVPLAGAVSAMCVGEFRAADGHPDVAVGVTGANGPEILVFDGATGGFESEPLRFALPSAPTTIILDTLDGDGFGDIAAALDNEVAVIHGWGRKVAVRQDLQIEHVAAGSTVAGIASGHFLWNREGRKAIAVLTDDGTVNVLQAEGVSTVPYSEEELATRDRGTVMASQKNARRNVDIETVAGWGASHANHASGWTTARTLSTGAVSSGAGARPVLTASNMGLNENDDITVGSAESLSVYRQTGDQTSQRSAFGQPAISVSNDIAEFAVSGGTNAAAVLQLPPKLNGERDMVMLRSSGDPAMIVPQAPSAIITVDRTDDPNGANLAAASACTAAGNDCSLRGAFQFANASSDVEIDVPAGTYVLSTNGTSQVGCDANSVGDLLTNKSTTLVGAGAATTIIRQTSTGPGSDGDRVMCMNTAFTPNLTWTFSGVTFTGGREGKEVAGSGTIIGGAGIIGGELDNSLTLSGVTLSNNQEGFFTISNSLGGGGIQITGGNLIITNCTIGGTSAPGAYTDRTSVNNANSEITSGGGLSYTPSSPQHTGGTGTLTVTGTTISRNTSSGLGGGGADLLIFAFGAPGGIGSGSASFGTSTLSNNQALATGNGGGILVESLGTTVATSSLTNNSASNIGGGAYLGGGSLTLDGTTPTITFSGNTATNGGSGIGVNVGIDEDSTTHVRTINATGGVQLKGTNTVLTGQDVFIALNGAWTNQAGSSLTFGNLIQDTGGNACGSCANFLEAAFKVNNTTTNIAGNWTNTGGTFVGDSGTVNVAGNLTFNQDGSGHGTFTAGTSTINFNGTGSQSISNNASITLNHLTDSNTTQPLTLNNSLAVNGNLTVNGANAILSPVAAAVISGTGTLTGTGTARASRTAATPDFLSQYTLTNKTLTNLTIDYNGAGNQTVNNAPAYSNVRISGSGIKTLQGNAAITGNLTIAAANFAGSSFNFSLAGNWTNSVGAGGFNGGTGTVTLNGSGGTQLLTGDTTFFNITLANTGATTNLGTGSNTVGGTFSKTAGSIVGGSGTFTFTGNPGAISGVGAKEFNNVIISAPANVTATGGNITLLNNYTNNGTYSQSSGNLTLQNDFTNNGTFTQNSGSTTTFASGADGVHAMAGAGTTTFGVFAINTANTVNASNNFNVVGATFTVTGTGVFNGSGNTVTFNAGAAQGIAGDGAKNFSGLTINNPGFAVTVINGGGAVEASVGGVLTLTTDLTVSSTGPAILQQSGTSAGAADVLGIVRRTDLGVTERSFGNVNNSITINSGTPPTQMDFNLVKAAPGTFPANVKVVPRDITLTPTGGSGISATLKMRYIDPGELTPSTITESRLILWKNVGGTTWTPQGGTPDTVNNFVSFGGVSSFSEWAIAEGSDLTLSKANSVAGSAVTGQPWNWTLTATNTGAPATFTAGQTILSDDLPTSNLNYGTPTVGNVSNITGSANISCSISSNTLTCTASGGSVTFDSNLGSSNFDVVFSATPQAAGSYQNPRTGGGIAKIDPNLVIVESNENNNTPTNNTVTVGKANTTTTINSDLPDPSVVGQPVTVTWSVSVNAPGALGAPLTGNVTVSDGTNQCVAAVSAGQCDVTFTSAGAKSITATYAGDTNYNGSASTPATAHTVNKADTTTTITSDNPDPSTPAQSVTVQWTVTVNSPGAGTPTGNVTVTVSGGAETCSAPVATGQCLITLNTTGARTLTATYAGDTNFNTSSDTESHQVCGNTVVTTTADSGAGSLRQVITDACDGNTITFNIPNADAGHVGGVYTITLTTGILIIDKNLTITGPNSVTNTDPIVISGGGASRAFNINPGKTVSINNLTITGGSVGAPGGGGILNSAGATLTLTGVTVRGNATTDSGGGVWNGGTLTVVNSTISGNTATTQGGGIANTLGASLTVLNSTISGNSAATDGGGLYNRGSLTLANVTVTGNTSDSDNNASGDGGGIFADTATFFMRNTIVSGNFKGATTPVANDIVGASGGGTDPASAFNLIGTGGSGGLTNGVNNNQVGVVDAGLGALADNGGPTRTHALLATSPAIEAGDNCVFDNTCSPALGVSLTTDQRGTNFPRKADSADANTTQTVDIGAFELHPSVEDIADKSTAEDTPFNFNFNIGDGTGALISTVTATSSNTTLVPNANLSVTGSGATRNLAITPAADANSPSDGTTTITVTVTATNGRTATDTFVVTVTDVNDAPVPTNDTVSDILEDCGSGCTAGKYVIPFATLLTNDTNKGATNESGQTLSVTGVSSPTGGTVAINGTNVEFTPTANFNGVAGFTYTVTDNGTTNGGSDPKSGNATVSFNITAVNDPPSFTKGADQTVNEDAGAQTVNSWATSISAGPADESAQTLTFNVTGNTNPSLFSAGPAVSSTGTLTYTPAANANGSATITLTLQDSGGTANGGNDTSAPQTFVINVTAVNDAPVVTTSGGSLSYTENAAATAIDPGLTVTDIDSANLVGATVAITSGFVSAQDTLAFTNQLGITGNYNSGTGVLTLTGTTTVANYQTALRTVTYQNSSDNPTATRTVTFTADDGAAANNTGSGTRNIAISGVNDPPVNTVPGPQGTSQNTPLTFSSGNGNQISISDVDAGTNTVQVTLTATNGTITLSGTSGLAFTVGDGTADATMTFTGTIANINTALNGMTFTPTNGFNGAASLTITTNDQGNSGSGGPLSDTDTVNIQVSTNITIQDAQVAEPASGSVNMIFTVTLSGPAPAGGTSVNFTTQDQAPALNHATAGQDYTTTSGTVSFAPNEQLKTISVPVLSDANNAEANETFQVVLSNPVNGTIATGTATGTILITNAAGTFIISELRTSGPGGAGDDFVELYNNTDNPLTVTASDASGGYGVFKMGANCTATPVLIATIPNGTVIPARGHYLLVGSQYSLANYGGVGAAAGDQTLTADIDSDRNVAVFSSANLVNISSANRLDAVGFGANSGGTCDLVREGTTLPAASGSALEYSFFRKECDISGSACLANGFPKDTNNNSADFLFADTQATATPMGQLLGAPGPQNKTSGIQRNATLVLPLLDDTIAAAGAPNRVRDTTPNTPNATIGPLGTLSIRRRVQNNTGGDVTALRFRIIDITTFPVAVGTADLRATTSSDVAVSNIHDTTTCVDRTAGTASNCTVNVKGTTLEQPPNQTKGGGFNSSLRVDLTGLPGNKLANGSSVEVQLLFGVVQPGHFRVFVNVEDDVVGGDPNAPGMTLSSFVEDIIVAGNQTITFDQVASRTFGDSDFNLNATASSGLPVSYAGSGNCAVTSVGNVHLTGAGTCTVTATQSGDATHNPATSQQTFTINRATPATSVSSSLNAAKLTQNITFTANVTPPANTTLATGTVQFKDGGVDLGPAVALDANGTATFSTAALSAGTHTITAVYSGNSNFNASTGTLASAQVVTNRPLVNMAAANYEVKQSDGFVRVVVNRSGDTSVPVTVDYATDASGSGNCAALTGVASLRCDVTAMYGTFRFAAGETQKTLDIPINQDAYTQGPETFTLTLSNVTGTDALLVTPAAANITINDAASPTPNAIDDTTIFVRQQYHDFLNREPDAAGLAFWKNNIDVCNTDTTEAARYGGAGACIETKRVITSAAFFLSIEFRGTGGLVRDFYVAALDRPASGNMPGFVEFTRDTQAVQAGVVVGMGNWQRILDTNREAFMADFVMRPEFVGLYSTADTPAQYVDKLYNHANVTPANGQERLDAIAEFGSATTASDPAARGRALLRITQNAAFQRRELNRGFVQMQYFGYLRRNPSDDPDRNLSGFDFWVSKLNQFNGDFIAAEMVKAFVASSEYRQRFGTP